MADLVQLAKYGESLTKLPFRFILSWWVSENGWSWDDATNNPGNVSFTGEGTPHTGLFTGVTQVLDNKVVVYDTPEHGVAAWAELINAPKTDKLLTVETADLLACGNDIHQMCVCVGNSNWAESHYNDGSYNGGLIWDVYKSPKMDELCASAESTPAPSTTLLQEGSTGDAVKELQKDLTDLGYDTHGIDGVFGENTKNAVEEFQSAEQLSVDGIVGNQTETAIQNEEAKGKIYHLESGDSLQAVANKFNVPLEILMRFNQFDGSTVLDPGAAIKIPSPYNVKSGETLSEIAQNNGYGSDYETIAAVNSLNPDRIYTGELIFL